MAVVHAHTERVPLLLHTHCTAYGVKLFCESNVHSSPPPPNEPTAKSTLERTVVLKQDRDGGYGFSLSKEGPVVTRVAAGSSAERAGVNAGDRLVKVRTHTALPANNRHPFLPVMCVLIW